MASQAQGRHRRPRSGASISSGEKRSSREARSNASSSGQAMLQREDLLAREIEQPQVHPEAVASAVVLPQGLRHNVTSFRESLCQERGTGPRDPHRTQHLLSASASSQSTPVAPSEVMPYQAVSPADLVEVTQCIQSLASALTDLNRTADEMRATGLFSGVGVPGGIPSSVPAVPASVPTSYPSLAIGQLVVPSVSQGGSTHGVLGGWHHPPAFYPAMSSMASGSSGFAGGVPAPRDVDAPSAPSSSNPEGSASATDASTRPSRRPTPSTRPPGF